MPRSAVKVSKSHESKVWDLQNRALDLETQLRQNEKNPEATDRLRIPYCETMADLLLADALFSLSHEVVQRLWRNCFYERIKDLRSKIHKEKKRLQRLKKNSSGGGGGGDSSLLAALDTNFTKFLQEAIALYNYIANHLEKKLLPPGMMMLSQENDYSQSAAYSESQQTQVTPSSASNEKNLDAIIPVLHLIYIHLGDLHRYANQLPQAQEKYQNAATLGPGHGHAYNQIAVVCQLKEQQGSSPLSAVALYWYCRSLLPDEEPFLVAKSNLQRLFGSNREWLLAQQEAEKVATVTHATKAAAVRAFLAQFADLHYDFYMGISPLNYPAPLAIKINKSMESFAGLLKLSAFGDALVCKMVTILAFSECHTPEQAAESGDASVVVQTTALVVRTTTYQMASLLADRVLLGLNKLKAAGGAAGGGGAGGGIKPAPNLSVRLLLPLLLVAEFTAHREATSAVTTTTATSNSMMPTMARSNGPEIQYKRALRTFWKKMVEVWNLLHPLAVAAGIDESKVDGLKEYEALRGFAPFSFMTAPNNNTTSSASQAADGADLPPGFLTSEEYVPLLLAKIQDGANNNNNASTQETGSTANSSKNATNMEQGRIKIARMLCLAKSLAEEMNSELGLSICRVSTGEYAWIEKEQEAAAVVMEDDDHAMMDIQNDSTRKTKDGDGNVLVYQEAVGGGPALLVPGALLQNQAPAPASIVHPTPVVATAAVATPQPAAGVAPFGGLGVDAASMRMTTPAATTMNASKPMAQQQPQQQPGAGVNLNSMLSGAQVPPPGMMTMQPPAPVNPPPGFGSPAPLASSTAMGMAPPGLGVVPPSQPMQPLSDSLHLLGGVSLATANPFASSASSTSVSDKNTSNMPFMQPMHQQNSSFLAPDDQAMDGVNLLDSGLLNSLWGGVEDANNSSTKNPFAAS